MILAEMRPRIAGIIALLAISIAMTACGAGGGSDTQQTNSPLVDTGQSQSGASGAATTAPNPPEDRTGGAGTTETATPAPGGSANIKVSPASATLDNLTLAITVGPARRMNTAASPAAGPTPQGQQGQGGAAQQEVVLGDRTQGVNKNLDAAQGPPPDPKEATGDFIRHVDIQVKDKATGQVVPYLAVSMDILRDGRPVQYDQALLPMVPAEGASDQMHYGNNVAFPGKGRYQLFVRIPANPMLGSNNPPSAQFEVTIE